MATRKLIQLLALLLLIVIAPVCKATSKAGEFLQPKSIGEFIWGEENVVFHRVRILASTIVSDEPSSCQFVQIATIVEQIRGSRSGKIEICSDRPQLVGTEYLVALFPMRALTDVVRREIAAKSGVELTNETVQLVQKPLWEYRIYTVRRQNGTTMSRVIVPATHLSVPDECRDKKEYRKVSYSDDQLETEYVMQHVWWSCFLKEVSSSKPVGSN